MLRVGTDSVHGIAPLQIEPAQAEPEEALAVSFVILEADERLRAGVAFAVTAVRLPHLASRVTAAALASPRANVSTPEMKTARKGLSVATSKTTRCPSAI